MDTIVHNIPFNSLNDDNFFDLLRPPLNNDVNVDPHNGNYDENIVNSLNSSSEELLLDFDDGDPVQSLPLSKYITDNQFKNLMADFKQDIFSLLHLNIRSLNKHFDDLKL